MLHKKCSLHELPKEWQKFVIERMCSQGQKFVAVIQKRTNKLLYAKLDSNNEIMYMTNQEIRDYVRQYKQKNNIHEDFNNDSINHDNLNNNNSNNNNKNNKQNNNNQQFNFQNQYNQFENESSQYYDFNDQIPESVDEYYYNNLNSQNNSMNFEQNSIIDDVHDGYNIFNEHINKKSSKQSHPKVNKEPVINVEQLEQDRLRYLEEKLKKDMEVKEKIKEQVKFEYFSKKFNEFIDLFLGQFNKCNKNTLLLLNSLNIPAKRLFNQWIQFHFKDIKIPADILFKLINKAVENSNKDSIELWLENWLLYRILVNDNFEKVWKDIVWIELKKYITGIGLRDDGSLENGGYNLFCGICNCEVFVECDCGRDDHGLCYEHKECGNQCPYIHESQEHENENIDENNEQNTEEIDADMNMDDKEDDNLFNQEFGP